MANYSEITFNAVTLKVTNCTPIKQPKTRKYSIGKELIQVSILGLNAQQWELTITGIITGTSRSDLATKRANIEALDDVQSHSLVDGIHDGTYYIAPGSLKFSDNGDDGGLIYRYSMRLVEE